MRKHPWCLAVGLSLGLTAPALARSDVFNTTSYCSSGAVRTCASFMITTAAGTGANSAGTVVDIFVRNLQGSHPNDNTGGRFITKIGLLNSGMGSVFDITGPNLVVSTQGTVGLSGTPQDNWDFGTQCNELASPFLCMVTGNPAKEGAIQGCTIDSNPNEWFQTCDTGFPGSVRFHFETSSRWFASQAQIAWKVQGTGGSLECVTTATSGDKVCNADVAAVPEPGTFSLLALGLVGLAAAGVVRRRR